MPEEATSQSGSASAPKPQPRGGRRGGGSRRGRGRGRRGPKGAAISEQRDEAQMSDKPEAAVEREDTAHAEGAAAIEAPMPHTEAGSEPESAETFNARPEDFPPEAEEQERSEVAPHETPREAEPGYVETPSRPEPQRHHPQQQRRHPQGYVRHPEHHEPRPQPRHPAVADAIQQVNEIIQTLKDSLDDMDEVLETLELAERQKNFDEQEIESLKRALRGLQRPREQGRGQQREHS